MIILYLLSCATNKDSENVKSNKERAYETYQKDEDQEQSIVEDQASIHKNYPEEVQKSLTFFDIQTFSTMSRTTKDFN